LRRRSRSSAAQSAALMVLVVLPVAALILARHPPVGVGGRVRAGGRAGGVESYLTGSGEGTIRM
jgi:hypothetical protein